MRGSEILANPDEGVKYLAGELASRLPHLSGNEAHALALAEMARRGIEPSWAAKCTARVAAKSAARTRNARLVREDVERESQEQPVETWRPLDLSQPSAWASGVVPATTLIEDDEEEPDFAEQALALAPAAREAGHQDLSQRLLRVGIGMDGADKVDGEWKPLDLSALADVVPQPKEFAIERVAPLGEATLFTGPGSAGKSLLGQQMATAAVSARQCLGLSVMPTPAIYISCEDDEQEMHRRQIAICAALRVSMHDLGDLTLLSLRGRLDNALASGDKGAIKPSAAYGRLVGLIHSTGAKLVLLDNVAHLFIGNENDRGEVTQFVNLLNRLAGETGAAIVLFAHTNKAGDSFSGSTAWVNAVRSQCFITHDEETDMRTLSLPKANYAQKGEVATFRWVAGAFVRDQDLPAGQVKEIAENMASRAEDRAFLACLRLRNGQGCGRAVGPSAGANYAPSQFEGMAEAKGHSKLKLKKAMDRLFTAGQIRTETVRNTDKSRDVTIIVEVETQA